MGYDYAEVPLPHTVRTKVVGAIAGAQTVPQVFINGEYIGSSEALEQFAKARVSAGQGRATNSTSDKKAIESSAA